MWKNTGSELSVNLVSWDAAAQGGVGVGHAGSKPERAPGPALAPGTEHSSCLNVKLTLKTEK